MLERRSQLWPAVARAELQLPQQQVPHPAGWVLLWVAAWLGAAPAQGRGQNLIQQAQQVAAPMAQTKPGRLLLLLQLS
jgi:hypothetical protein